MPNNSVSIRSIRLWRIRSRSAICVPDAESVTRPFRLTRISPSRLRRRTAIITAGAETPIRRASVAAITGSPSACASAMVLR